MGKKFLRLRSPYLQLPYSRRCRSALKVAIVEANLYGQIAELPNMVPEGRLAREAAIVAIGARNFYSVYIHSCFLPEICTSEIITICGSCASS